MILAARSLCAGFPRKLARTIFSALSIALGSSEYIRAALCIIVGNPESKSECSEKSFADFMFPNDKRFSINSSTYSAFDSLFKLSYGCQKDLFSTYRSNSIRMSCFKMTACSQRSLLINNYSVQET